MGEDPRLFYSPLLTDLYEVTMAYSYFLQGRHKKPAVFDVFFRENPFHGKYTIFTGLQDVLEFIYRFNITKDQAEFLAEKINIPDPKKKQQFIMFLMSLGKEAKKIKVYAIEEGTIVFPRIPVMRLEGPLALLQLLETPVLNLTGYASLVTTNAARMKKVVGLYRTLLEFGLRRAQGPDGGLVAAKYAVVGGFSGTSNCLAGYYYDLKVSGTLAHAYISSFSATSQVKDSALREVNFCDLVSHIANTLSSEPRYQNADLGERNAFISYAVSFPENFLVLADTYDTLRSGVPNFLIVSFGLMILGVKPKGLRLDSGDLNHLSKEARKMFVEFKKDWRFCRDNSTFRNELINILSTTTCDISSLNDEHQKLDDYISSFLIVASNDLNEQKLKELIADGKTCEINSFGIGTHLVTCQETPALGLVYKLAKVEKQSCMKFSEQPHKETFPDAKEAYRLYDQHGRAMCDVMQLVGEKTFSGGRNKKEVVVLRFNGEEIKLNFSSAKLLHGEFRPFMPSKPDKYYDALVEKVTKTLFFDEQRVDESVFSDKQDFDVYVSKELYNRREAVRKEKHLERQLNEEDDSGDVA